MKTVGPYLLAAILACPEAAWAQLAAAIDANGAVDLHGGAGGGVDGRFGDRFGIPRGLFVHFLIFQPEIVVGWLDLRLRDRQDLAAQIGSVGGGLRVGILDASFEPFAYAHASAAFGGEGFGSLIDAGVALDLRLRGSSLGLHGSYSTLLAAGDHTAWFEVGPHFEVRWFGP